MTTEELIFRHVEAAYSDKCKDIPLQHVKLSIQFAISVLEELHEKNKYKEGSQALYYKIQELKQYLDEQ